MSAISIEELRTEIIIEVINVYLFGIKHWSNQFLKSGNDKMLMSRHAAIYTDFQYAIHTPEDKPNVRMGYVQIIIQI